MTVIEPEEMLVEVVLSANPPRTGSNYQQVSRQNGGYAQAAVVSVVTLDERNRCKAVRLVLMSVGETPILSRKASQILVGHEPTAEAIKAVAEAAARSEIDPVTDLHATADYRRNLIRVLTTRSLTEAVRHAQNGGQHD